jgi:hypothetical protein
LCHTNSIGVNILKNFLRTCKRVPRFVPVSAACSVLVLACLAAADEWKASHALISPTGVMNLPAVPQPEDTFFFGPVSPEETENWLGGLKAWRTERLTRLRYNGSQYERPELEWTQHVFSQVQMLIWDRSFYDSEKGEYTVERFLRDTESRIGSVDAVLIWHVYPNLGVDDRNQFDLLRDMPGGIPALRKVVQQFHKHSVKVFFPFLTWDTGTRQEGAFAWEAVSRLLKGKRSSNPPTQAAESVLKCGYGSSDERSHRRTTDTGRDSADCRGVCN